MTKKEFADVKHQRKMAQASLDFSEVLEPLRKKHKLTRKEMLFLLQEQYSVYFTSLLKNLR
jgi:hypothetical protein